MDGSKVNGFQWFNFDICLFIRFREVWGYADEKKSVKRKVFYVSFFPTSHQANYSFVCCKQASRNWSCKFYFKNHKNCSKVESSYKPPFPPSLHFLLTTKILINFYANFAITESVLQCFALFSGNNKNRSRIHIQLWACFFTSGTANMCQWRWLGSVVRLHVRWICTTTIPPLLHFPSTFRDEFFSGWRRSRWRRRQGRPIYGDCIQVHGSLSLAPLFFNEKHDSLRDVSQHNNN